MDVLSIRQQQHAIRETGNALLKDLSEIKLLVHQGLPIPTETAMQFLGDVQKHQAKLTAITQEVLKAYLSQLPPRKTYLFTLLEPDGTQVEPTEQTTIRLGDTAYIFECPIVKEQAL